jgi:hypothetical protein
MILTRELRNLHLNLQEAKTKIMEEPSEIIEEIGNEEVTCPPKTEPVLMLDWQNKKGGQTNGQEGVQTRANHWQTA